MTGAGAALAEGAVSLGLVEEETASLTSLCEWESRRERILGSAIRVPFR